MKLVGLVGWRGMVGSVLIDLPPFNGTTSREKIWRWGGK
jgi:hypothetical protein